MNVGIDLGMSFSVIAVKGQVTLCEGYPPAMYLPECDVSIIPSPEGDCTFPSVFWADPLDPSHVLVGIEAKQKAQEGEVPIMFSKRSIGTSEPLRIHDRSFSAKEVATQILKYLKACAEQALGQPVLRAVVTHPAYFTHRQIEETREAAVAAGFEMSLPEQTMMEPVAATLAYTVGVEKDPLKVMTYDLGGGTFDVTVLERSQGGIAIKSFDGNYLLGGYNFDQTLMRWVLDRLRTRGRTIPHDENAPEHLARRARLLQLAEGVKIKLSEQRSSKAWVDVRAQDILVDAEGRIVPILERINREEYAALIKDYLDETIRCCHSALGKAGMTAEELDDLLLVGGSTYGQWVIEAVQQAFGKEVHQYNPDLCVAAGAALRAAELPTPANAVDLAAIFQQIIQSAGSSAIDLYEPQRQFIATPDAATLSDIFSRYVGDDYVQLLFDSSEPPKRVGTFDIIKPIGRGTFTAVYLARDRCSLMGKLVALKIPFRQTADASWLDRLSHEAEIWRSLSSSAHPNILAFEDLRREDGYNYFVTEYVDGSNWAEWLAPLHGEQRAVGTIAILYEVCKGLAHAHTQKIPVVHGDIKPANILVSEDRQTGSLKVKLGDFGLSIAGGEGASTEPRGTQIFMAPEAFEGKRTVLTDVYSLGVTLEYLLTGEYPFRFSPAPHEQLKEDRIHHECNIRTVNRHVPEWLEAIVRRCLAATPEERFANAQELLEYLTPFVDPSRSPRTILMAWCKPESQTIDYELEVRGHFTQELLTQEASAGLVAGLGKMWEELGELAVERAGLVQEGCPCMDVDEKIKSLLRLIAEDGAHEILGPKVRGKLAEHPPGVLWLMHDPRLGGIPWELLGVTDSCLCRRYSLARSPRLLRPRMTRLAIAPRQSLRVLIVADSCGDLPGAQAEGDRLKRELGSSPVASKLEIEVAGVSDNPFVLRGKMRRCDVLHYAGHGLFPEKSLELSESGFFLKGDLEAFLNGDPAAQAEADVLRASALEDFWDGNAPFLVFANACSSGRGTPRTICRPRVYSDAAMGLAQAMLASGVENYIGTVWDPPDDEQTGHFASIFYREFFNGRTIGAALQAARGGCRAAYGEADLTWARYVLFGSPLTHLPLEWLARPYRLAPVGADAGGGL